MSNLETRRFSISYTADLLFCFNVSIIYPCPYTYIVDFCYTHIYMCFVFHLALYFSRMHVSLFCIVASYAIFI